jgi:hypothetical protein
MSKYLLITVLILGLVLVLPGYSLAASSLSAIQATNSNAPSTNAVISNKAALSETTGIDNEDIGIADNDEDSLPELEDEVLIDFESGDLDGDPDRPVITGDLPNADTADKDHKGEIDILSPSDPEPDKKGDDVGLNPQPDPLSLDASVDLNPQPDPPSSSKPIEIVVVGSKLRDQVQTDSVEVRGWDPVKKELTIGTADIQTGPDLADYAQALTVSDGNIKQIKISDHRVSLDYSHPALLFGFIPVNMNTLATVTFGDGARGARVNVKFPWYKFLTKNNAAQIQQELKKTIENTGDDQLLVNIDLQNILQKQQQVLQTMSNVMKTMHDTTKSIIQNLR